MSLQPSPATTRQRTLPRVAITDIEDMDITEEVGDPIHDLFELSDIIGDERIRHEHEFYD